MDLQDHKINLLHKFQVSARAFNSQSICNITEGVDLVAILVGPYDPVLVQDCKTNSPCTLSVSSIGAHFFNSQSICNITEGVGRAAVLVMPCDLVLVWT